MGLKNIKECSCPETTCKYHSNCQACALAHSKENTMPYCLFVDNDGDSSIENYYRHIENRPAFPHY